jgi:hypothetical protein
MSFLNPLMLFGALAIAIPIIIHFLNRRKFKRVMWAAMKFVKISVDQNQRRMRLEDLILLLIRCAMVALLAFALARPAMKSSTTDALGQAKVTSVVILDNSYSMDLRGEDGNSTAFAQAQAAAKATIKALPSGSAVSLLLASDMVQGVIDEPTYDLNQAEKEIDRAQVGHHATNLYPAVEKAVGILKGRADLRKEIYVITDGQASGWRQSTDVQRLIGDHKDIKLYVLRVGEKVPAKNLAITRMDVFSGLTPVKHPLQFEIEVTNHNDNDSGDVKVGLYVKAPGKEWEKKPRDQVAIPSVKAGETTSVSLYTSLEEEGYHSIRAAFPDPSKYDDLAADNQRQLVVHAVKEVPVLIVDGDQESADISYHESFYLERALSPEEDEGKRYVKVSVKSPEDFTQGGLKRYTAVMIANVPRFSPENITVLEDYLRQGGGLVFYPGDKTDEEFYNRVLYKERGVLPSRWESPIGDDTQDEVYVEFQKRAYEHPITALWNNPEYDLGSARTRRWHPLDETDKDRPDVKEVGPATVVLRYDTPAEHGEGKSALGAPAIMEREWSEGRVYQFSSTADFDWCTLARRADLVVPLVRRIIGSVQEHSNAGLNLRVGEPFLQVLASHQNNSEGTVMMPSRNQATALSAEVINDRPVMQYKDTHQAGLYEFKLKGDSQKKLFAVQPDQSESVLRKISDDELPEAAGIIDWDGGDDEKKFEDKVQEARVGAEYWLLIFLIVLALAGLETYLAQKFSQSA